MRALDSAWNGDAGPQILSLRVKDLCYQTNPIGDGFLNKHFQVVSLSYTVKAQIGSLHGEGASKCHNWGPLSRPTPFSALLPAASIWCRMVEVLAVGWKGRIYSLVTMGQVMTRWHAHYAHTHNQTLNRIKNIFNINIFADKEYLCRYSTQGTLFLHYST